MQSTQKRCNLYKIIPIGVNLSLHRQRHIWEAKITLFFHSPIEFSPILIFGKKRNRLTFLSRRWKKPNLTPPPKREKRHTENARWRKERKTSFIVFPLVKEKRGNNLLLFCCSKKREREAWNCNSYTFVSHCAIVSEREHIFRLPDCGKEKVLSNERRTPEFAVVFVS